MYSYLSTEPQKAVSFGTVTREGEQPATDNPKPWGLVTLNVTNWHPNGPGSCPPSLTNGFSFEVSRQFAIAYNKSLQSRQRHRWAVVMTNSTILFLSNINHEDRPEDPAGFPPCVKVGFTQREAEETMISENRERHRVAHVPRSWTVALKPMTESEAEKTGA